ncbi:MAG: ATP-binding protein [Deltaproteobacteria bacterium]|nr:ATP-binding protein [Deltaproteobacteria bacterium]
MAAEPITRSIEYDLEQLLRPNKKKGAALLHHNVILITGPRQVGKTTLVRSVLRQRKIPYVEWNLEKTPALAAHIDRCEDFDAFTEWLQLAQHFSLGKGQVLFIDEAQESHRLGQFVRFMKEDERWAQQHVILSGSIMSQLFREVRFPVGRVTRLCVQTFSFEEFLRTHNQSLLAHLHAPSLQPLTPQVHTLTLQLLDQYLTVGGLPEVVTQYDPRGKDKTWQQTRENLLYGYFQDFRRVHGEERHHYLAAALKTTAHLLGMPFKNSHVSLLLDGGKNQHIIEALGQLEAWEMIRTIDQRGPAVESHFHPKRYLFDIGIAKQLRETTIPPIALLQTLNAAQRQPLGGLIENVAANALAAYSHESAGLAGWKKASSGSEVDFVIQHRGTTIPIECKAALHIKNTHLTGLHDFLRQHHTTLGVLVGLAPLELRAVSDQEHVLIVPLYFMDWLHHLLNLVGHS